MFSNSKKANFLAFFETFRRFSVCKQEITHVDIFTHYAADFWFFRQKVKALVVLFHEKFAKNYVKSKKSEVFTALVKMACDEATVTVSFS